ncbi:unnamed protein product [Psylliodes chrysocephalus]|uniref:Uncharacterized protein n=1 Tax=Psylliodes chrysocephalus TaxID=3402493 RepID=A0A9P0GF34_9CUCU|nr:unnamed protein product [Psylliodes chrysocephala]
MHENRKKELRKNKAVERREILLTGGGPPSKKYDSDDNILLDIVNKKTVFGTESIWCSDSASIPTASTSRNSKKETDEIFIFKAPGPSWKTYKALDLKRPVTAALKVHHTETNDVETPQRQKTKIITSRRRPATVVKALSSNHLAEK